MNVPEWCQKYNVPRAVPPAKVMWEPPSALKPCKRRDHLEVVEVKLVCIFIDKFDPEKGKDVSMRVPLGVAVYTADGTRWMRAKKGNWSVKREGETKPTPIGNSIALRRVYPHMADLVINAYKRWCIDNNV